MKIAVIGVGLIGGSFAKDIHRLWPEARIYGVDSSDTHLQQAEELGLIHEKATYADLKEMDMVLVTMGNKNVVCF